MCVTCVISCRVNCNILESLLYNVDNARVAEREAGWTRQRSDRRAARTLQRAGAVLGRGEHRPREGHNRLPAARYQIPQGTPRAHGVY